MYRATVGGRGGGPVGGHASVAGHFLRYCLNSAIIGARARSGGDSKGSVKRRG